MAEGDALLMIRQQPNPRNRVLLTVFYGGGLRWRDLAARGEAGQATVFGKGGKTRGAALRLDVRRAGGPARRRRMRRCFDHGRAGLTNRAQSTGS